MDHKSTKVGRKRKTHKEFVKEVYDLVGDEYTVIDKYEKARKKVNIRHNTCGYEYEVLPNAFTSKQQRCPRCTGNENVDKRGKSHEIYVKEVENLVGEEYTVVGRYKNTRERIQLRHNTCGYEYQVLPNAFTKKNERCPKCMGLKKKTQVEYEQDVKDIHGNEYAVLGVYRGSDEKIRVKHNKCGYEWEVRAHKILGQTECPECAGNVKKTHQRFVEEVERLNPEEYTVIGEYINNRTKIKVKHNLCGEIYEVVPSTFLRGVKCPGCGKKSKRNTYV